MKVYMNILNEKFLFNFLSDNCSISSVSVLQTRLNGGIYSFYDYYWWYAIIIIIKKFVTSDGGEV